MAYFWVTVVGQGSGTVQAKCVDEARVIGSQRGEVSSVETLPYAAVPVWSADPDTWTLCYDPQRCKGMTCCPKSYACSE